ncbi:MAG: zf-TFIIB domain-containing protein [Planctomycetes bacterium]|nr:zf-TFIIB domain-containing protein [Planctomycetota bacterium]
MDSPARNLIACPRCARQYDVGDLRFGECVRCLCGEMLRWVQRAAHDPERRRCPHCGAPCPAQAHACSYCKAEIQLDDRGLAEVCPGCYARLLRGAHFCMECGLSIQPQALHALPVDLACPRCRAGLRRRTLGRTDVIECSSCAGLWLSHDTVKRLVENAEHADVDGLDLPQQPVVLDADARPEGYVPCVACGQLMQRRNFAGSSGVIVDMCGPHGVWFDHRELERVLEFVRAGGLRRSRERELDRQEERLRRLRESAPPAGGLPGEFLGPPARPPSDLLDFFGEAGRVLGHMLRLG